MQQIAFEFYIKTKKRINVRNLNKYLFVFFVLSFQCLLLGQDDLKLGYVFEINQTKLHERNDSRIYLYYSISFGASFRKYIFQKPNNRTSVGINWQYTEIFLDGLDWSRNCELEFNLDSDPNTYTLLLTSSSVGAVLEHQINYRIKKINVQYGIRINPKYFYKAKIGSSCIEIEQFEEITTRPLQIWGGADVGLAYVFSQKEIFLKYRFDLALQKFFVKSEGSIIDTGLEHYTVSSGGLAIGLNF